MKRTDELRCSLAETLGRIIGRLWPDRWTLRCEACGRWTDEDEWVRAGSLREVGVMPSTPSGVEGYEWWPLHPACALRMHLHPNPRDRHDFHAWYYEREGAL